MPASTDPQVVVVTGATAGVGRAVVQLYAREGARIGLLARGKQRLEDTKREVEALGGQAIAIPTDVADADAVEAAAAQVEEAFGPIDVWINNAMTAVFAEFWDVEPDEYRRVTEVTYLGQAYGALAAVKRMRPRDRGTIVFVGSALAYRGIPLQSAYCGAKHGIQGLFDSLRTELMHHKSNVQLTMVQLPAINTPQHAWVRNKLSKKPMPVPPIYQPEVAARAIHYAARHPRRELWVGYPTIQAIAGNKLVPGLADRYLAEAGYTGQLTDEPNEKGMPGNLFEPVEGDFGAHGTFDAQATNSSPALWASTHPGWLTAAAGLLGLAAGVLLSRD